MKFIFLLISFVLFTTITAYDSEYESLKKYYCKLDKYGKEEYICSINFFIS